MAIVGFNFTKISAEKKGPLQGKININNNVSIKNVSEAKLTFKAQNQKALKYDFEYVSDYGAKLGQIKLEGEVITLDNEDKASKIIDEFKKSKKIAKDIVAPIINIVLNRCNIQSLIIGKELNLPPSIPMPKVSQK